LVTSIWNGRPEIGAGGGYLLEHGLEELLHVVSWGVHVLEGAALAGHGVEDGEVELLVGGAEVGHEVEGEVHDLFRAGVLAVCLVYDDDGLEAELYGLAQHEPGLGHGAFRGVDQQQAAVDHAEDALDLAAEVRVAWGVDYVDLDAPVLDGGVLGQDGDAAFLLEHVRVHGALCYLLPVPELERLAQQGVHERRLAVVDVRDDGDVAVVHAFS
jgi:hypothetical protein